MKAVALHKYLPISDPESLIDIELEKPTPSGRDVLVAVKAISVNPVDTKIRAPKPAVEAKPKVLGWDAAGEVVAVGANVALFKPGDKVYYAGDVTRPGSNSEFQLVDERIVGRMPTSLSFEQAAALPLTAITAWEGMFDRMRIPSPPRAMPRRSILLIGGAGGVGSIAIQLAAKVAGLTVIATASRPESEKWCRSLGAQHIINHFEDMPAALKRLGFESVDYVFLMSDTDKYFATAAQVIAPQGMICSIVTPKGPLDLGTIMPRGAGFVWESMFTRSRFHTNDMIEQHYLLCEVARLVDQGILKTTMTEVLSPINAANLRKAHAMVEGGRTIGKIVLKDF
jgi:zinc-binding alcohol dehydrogenase family protein